MSWICWDFSFVCLVNLVAFSVAWMVIFTWSRISWIDVLWAAAIGIWSLDYLHFWSKDFVGWSPMVFLAALYFLWSLRLSVHLAKRLSLHRDAEDPRYRTIKGNAGKKWPLQSYAIFLLNATLASLLILPQRLLARLEHPDFKMLFWAGATLSLCSIAGEALADRQLRNFLADRNNRRNSCQVGLWRYSRHPNYFFEWLFWVGIFLALVEYPYGYWSALCPIVMFVFLTQFTGIKLSEKGAASRRSDFQAYQEKTSAFFPLPPKK